MCLYLVVPCIARQAPTTNTHPEVKVPAVHVQSSLVLVDVITQDPKSGMPVRNLKREDFRIFNDRREVSIESFDTGSHYQTRPIVVWLTVLCNEGGKIAGSREFSGKEALFRPALEQLDKSDTVGVVHWCDNGEEHIDLMPTGDRDLAIRTLSTALKRIPFNIGGNSNLLGEDSLRRMIRLVLQDGQQRNPQPLPVFVFIYGGRGAQPYSEVDDLIGDILETSGIVFGIKDEDQSNISPAGPNRRGHIFNYLAEQTGGQYFSARPEGYAAALEAILLQLHFRYQLGFIPPSFDGKRHEIDVRLSDEVREKHKGVRLRFRTEYIPLREPPDWAR
jgi:hypothetical protein